MPAREPHECTGGGGTVSRKVDEIQTFERNVKTHTHTHTHVRAYSCGYMYTASNSSAFLVT